MRVIDMLHEMRLRYRTTSEQADRLERSILKGHVKRPMTDVELIRRSLPAFVSDCMALRGIHEWSDRLPPEFVELVEKDYEPPAREAAQ